MNTATRNRVLNALLTVAMAGATAPLRAQAIVVTTSRRAGGSPLARQRGKGGFSFAPESTRSARR